MTTPPPRKRKRSEPPGPDLHAPKKPRLRRRRSAPPQHGAAPEKPVSESPDATAEARMREIEDRLDRMIDARARERDGLSAPSLPSDLPHLEPPWRDSHSGSPNEDVRSSGATSTAADEVDEFGYDPAYERRLRPLLDMLYESYFRVEPHGIERVPDQGRCLLVANHSGTIPLDGLMLRMAVRREHPRHRGVRWLAEDGIFHFPFLGNMTNRVGAVRACQENAERLLESESLVAVFPEGRRASESSFATATASSDSAGAAS